MLIYDLSNSRSFIIIVSKVPFFVSCKVQGCEAMMVLLLLGFSSFGIVMMINKFDTSYKKSFKLSLRTYKKLTFTLMWNHHSVDRWFRIIGPPLYRDSLLYGPNLKEQKLTKGINNYLLRFTMTPLRLIRTVNLN